MGHKASSSLKVKLSASKIWVALADYGGVEKYAPTVKSSAIVGNIESGLGAQRSVTIHYDGSSVIEEIIDYQEGRGYKMKVSELSSPLKSMLAEIFVDEIDTGSSEIKMSVDFEVKGGPFGWLMGQFMLKPMMNGVLRKFVNGLVYYAATGNTVDSKLPSEEELNTVVERIA